MATNEALYAEAEKLKESGDLAAAAVKLTELVAQDPKYALAHTALGVIFTKLGRHDEAVTHALATCELEPNDPFSFTALSVAYMRAGKIFEAEEAMARARTMPGAHHH